MAPSFRFRHELLNDEWDTARGFLVHEFDGLYAALTGGIISGDVSVTGNLTVAGSILGPSAFIPAAFNASEFFGSAPIVWTVTAANAVTWGYWLTRKMMTVIFDIRDTTVTNLGTRLIMTIPGGYVPTRTVLVPLYLQDNGTGKIGVVYVVGNSRTLNCELVPTGNFTPSAGLTQVAGQITFEVQ